MIIKQEFEDALELGKEDLVQLIRTYALAKSSLCEDLRHLFLSSSYSSKIEASKLSSEDFMFLVMLCLAYSAINSDLINTPIFSRSQNTVFEACASFDIDPKLVVPVSSIEHALYEILESD